MPEANQVTRKSVSLRSRGLLVVILISPVIAIGMANGWGGGAEDFEGGGLRGGGLGGGDLGGGAPVGLMTSAMRSERWAAPLIALTNPSPVHGVKTFAPGVKTVGEKIGDVEEEMEVVGGGGDDRPRFNGRPLRVVRSVRMKVTAYSPDERSCENFADYITASGYSVFTNAMKMVAADTRLFPFGTVMTIPGYNGGLPVVVLDRGGAIKGLRLDVLYPTDEIARGWGVQNLEVTVWEYD